MEPKTPKYKNLQPCPWCNGIGNHGLAVRKVENDFYHVVCIGCYSYGPIGSSPTWAVKHYYRMHPLHAEYERARRIRQSGCIKRREYTKP